MADVQIKDKTIDVYLDEMNVAPPAYKHVKLSSTGFHAPVTVQPIRGRAVFLRIRRRKWKVEETGANHQQQLGYNSRRNALHKKFRVFFKRNRWTTTRSVAIVLKNFISSMAIILGSNIRSILAIIPGEIRKTMPKTGCCFPTIAGHS
ncbi:ISAon1 family transposase N-terminal region protein [Gaoshiqia sediminis]|uniref:ISAon1 family transposase N-terminal region protein n=1 Tax=Gaoshiqia sediminis TaxID=2986998 RepID=UPI003D0BF268